MSHRFKRASAATACVAAALLLVAACSSSKQVDGHVVDPCGDECCQYPEHCGECECTRGEHAGRTCIEPPPPLRRVAAAKPYAGQTVTIEAYSAVAEFDYYKTLMPAFTAQTGIKVNYVQLPVDAMDQKIPLQLSAKDNGLDVFFTGSEKITAFAGSGGAEPLDPYISDTSQTPASYNFTDIAPAVETACQQGGKTYCIATHTGGAVLYYNTKLFAAAGISGPPQTSCRTVDRRPEADQGRRVRVLRAGRQVADVVRRVPALELVRAVGQRDHRHVLRQELELPDR